MVFFNDHLSTHGNNAYYVCIAKSPAMKVIFITIVLAGCLASVSAQEPSIQKKGDTTEKVIETGSWLEGHVNELAALTIQSKSRPYHPIMQPVGMERFTQKEIRNLPVFMGEKDLMKTIQLLPGVKSAGDGNSGFYVRGGGSDQNLVLLDGAPVYNASHLMGFFSVFNGDAVKDFSLYKSQIPAQYGGRLSSVLDVTMNEGSHEDFKVSGGIGLIASRLNVEGPLDKGKSSFLISGRRTYADLFLKLSPDSNLRNNDLNFYDLNLKLHFITSKKDEVSVTGYIGKDRMYVHNSFGLNWGNKLASLHWKHSFNGKLSVRTNVFYSDYDYNATLLSSQEALSTSSGIKDVGVQTALHWKGEKADTRLGVQSIYHMMSPGHISSEADKTSAGAPNEKSYSFENALFFNSSVKVSKQFQLNYGFRLSSFSVMGGQNIYPVDQSGNVKDTLRYAAGQVVKSYINAEPRIAGIYKWNNNSAFNFSYARTVQPLHLLANTTGAAPTDQWISSGKYIQPELANQWSIGYTRQIKEEQFSASAEAYYKTMQHLPDYRDGAEIFNNDPIESKLLFGKGRSYGLELMLKKKKGKLTGWIAYTLSKTERQTDGINDNNWYLARQDRTHEISLVSSLQLSDKWVLSANWVFNTGSAITLPAGKYVVGNRLAYYYTARNAARMPDYHRLDIAATVQLHQRTRSSSELHFGVYNAYGRENAYSIYMRRAKEDINHTEVVQMSLFRFVPSVTYNFKF